MKKIHLISIVLLCSFVYGQNTGILDKNYANIDKNNAEFNQEIYENNENSKNAESKKSFYASGKIKSEIILNSGKSKSNNKTVVNWYESGQIKSVINYTNYKYNGSLTTFWENGNPRREDIYKMGKLINGKCFDNNGNKTAYYNYEILPAFKGGLNSLYSFINNELKYPEEALENDLTGKVIVYLTINEFGKIIATKIIKGSTACLNNEALRIVNKMPEWNAGKIDGESAKMEIGLPILFNIAD